MKKIVVFGGGSGLSAILLALKDYPIEITAVITTTDSGGSTGALRKEFNMPAFGDIRNVIGKLAADSLVSDLLRYRFKSNGIFNNHSLGNLMFTALFDITNDAKKSINYMCELFKINIDILPVTEEYANICARTKNNKLIRFEHNIESNEYGDIDYIFYDKDVNVNSSIITKIQDADLLIFGIGCLYTSIIPTIIPTKIKNAIIIVMQKKCMLLIW